MKQEQITQFLDGLNIDHKRKILIRSLIEAVLDNTVEVNQIATDKDAGVVKLGYQENAKNYPLLVDDEGHAYVAVPWVDTDTKYNKANDTTLGLIKTGYQANGKNYPVLLDNDGKAYVAVNWTDTNTTYDKATDAVLGLVKIGYVQNDKNYPILLDADGKAYVNVPWVDTNTTYSVMTAATPSAAGNNGLVPAPPAGAQIKFLRGDGTWQIPTDTTYDIVGTKDTQGLIKNGSDVTSPEGYVPCPIINGIPYYKEAAAPVEPAVAVLEREN